MRTLRLWMQLAKAKHLLQKVHKTPYFANALATLYLAVCIRASATSSSMQQDHKAENLCSTTQHLRKAVYHGLGFVHIHITQVH